MLLVSSGITHAQNDNNLFNHLSVGVSVGTEGLPSIDVAAPIGNYVQVRAGYAIMPKFKFKADIDYTRNGNKYTADVAIKLNKGDFKLLFDAYPFKKSSFHFTAGAYIGSSEFAKIYNDAPLAGIDPSEWGTAQIQISNNPEHMFSTDNCGNVKGRVKVAGFKPYLGIGFGRVVPSSRLTVNFDLGLQIWGKPKVEMYQYDITGLSNKWVEFKKADFDDWYDTNGNLVKHKDKDGYNLVKICNGIFAYPVLQVRLGFRIF